MPLTVKKEPPVAPTGSRSSLTVNKAGSTVKPAEESVDITATYGETITLTAEVAKAQTNGTALMAAQDEVEFLCGKTSLGTALVRYSDDSHTTGTATLTYDTRHERHPRRHHQHHHRCVRRQREPERQRHKFHPGHAEQNQHQH